MMKTNQNNHIMNMNKGMKQKLSMLLIACLLFTGYRGLTIPGRAEQGNTEQNNAISVSGTQVKVQLLGEDLRRAAKEAIEKGERVDDSVLKGYSKDEELQKSYAGIFSLDKEVYEIPLDSISEGLSESLAEEEAGLQVFVERDAQDLDNLVRKESKESLLLYDGKSQLEQLFPKGEETESVKKEEEGNLASDSNLVRNTELTGSELITFLYKNKADHRITFQLSVDGNKYPKVTVSPKTQLFKELVDKLKKEEKKVPVETAKVPESKIEESTEAKGVTSEEQLAESVTSSEEVKKTAGQAASKEETIEASVAEASTEGSASKVSIVSEEKKEETSEQETSEAAVKAEEKNEEPAEAETASEAPVKKENTKEVEAKFSGFLQDVVSHYEEFLGELVSARFSQYSLNELGRKSQNVEIEGFATVEVFYEEAAFDRAVVLEAKRLFKPEEEVEGEKLSEEQVKALKEHFIYDDGASLDIRFVDKNDPSVEVEPLSPVGVRITLEKKALPETVSPDTISIHHLVENDETKEIERVELVVESGKQKKLEEENLIDEEALRKPSKIKNEEKKQKEESTETIVKEFTVNSFSLYQITFTESTINLPIKFHYVDKNFNEIGPTVRVDLRYYSGITYWNDSYGKTLYVTYDNPQHSYYKRDVAKRNPAPSDPAEAGEAMKYFKGYKFLEVYPFKAQFDSDDPKNALTKEQQDPHLDHWDKNISNPNDYFDFRYKYSPGRKEFGEGVDFIDDTGFQTVDAKNIGLGVTRWVWMKDGRYQKCGTREFYFVYDIEPTTANPRIEEEPESRQEKYITNNLDGTYDLTLTAQVKNKSKEKLDVVFLIDTSKNMNLSFDKKHGSEIITEKDYAPSGFSRKDKVQEYATKMVEELLKNQSYDLQFGIVGFGGSKTLTGDVVKDKAYDDITYIGGYTNSAAEFKSMIQNIPESKGDRTGTNYAAAILGMRHLIDGSFSPSQLPNTKFEIKKPRRDTVSEKARRIVIMLTDSDPVYSFIFDDKFKDKRTNQEITDKYDETERKADGSLRSFVATLKKGDSYGNGVDFSRVALNQARGILSMPNEYVAFYSIGVGNKENWTHLNELTEKHGYDHSRDWSTVPGYKDKYIQAKSPLAKNVDSKVFDGSTADNLHEAFQEIYKRIARNQVQNVEISDTLTRFVQPVDTQNPKSTVVGQLVKLKANGVEVDHEVTDPHEKESLNFKGFDIKVNDDYIENGKKLWRITLKTIPEDFTLPAGYEIRAVAKIIPTVDAFEEIGKTFYNGEYHVAPKSLDPHGTENIIIGDARTDLNAIYKEDLNREQSDKLRYASSTGQPGLPTNTEATLSYKVNGKDENKKYNKPIINPGNMVIEKAFLGFDEGEFFKESSGLTVLGKEILKTISFRISRENAAGTEELLTTVSPADYLGENEDKILKLPNTNLYIKVSRVFKEHRSGTPYARAYGNPNISISIYNTPLNMKYRVKEVESSQGKIFSTGTKGYQFDKDAVRHGGQTEDLKLMNVRRNYHFFNTYKNVPVPKREKTITIRKVVEEFGGTAFTPEALNKKFDFFIALYRYDGSKYTPLSLDEADALVKKWRDQHPKFASTDTSTIGRVQDNVPVQMPDGSTVMTYMPKISLKHGESITLQLDENIHYKILESLDKDYEVAKAEEKYADHTQTTAITKVRIYQSYYSSTGIYDQGMEFTFKNPRITLVPTGLRGDIIPYLFSIFGFTMMAGMYLTIRKRKRVEM